MTKRQKILWLTRAHKTLPMDRPAWVLENCSCDSCRYEALRRRDGHAFWDALVEDKICVREYPVLHDLAMAGEIDKAVDYIKALCHDSH
jgi:hypothetical protein